MIWAHNVRSTNSAPKANTRFLKNIIKETDSHNAPLRAKEVTDSRTRLEGVRWNEHTKVKDSRGCGRLEDLGNGHRSKRRRVESNGELEMAHSTRSGSSHREYHQNRQKSKDRGYRHHYRGLYSGSKREIERSGISQRRYDHYSSRRRSSSSSSPQAGRLSRSRTPSPHRSKSHRQKHYHRTRRRRDSDHGRRKGDTSHHRDHPQYNEDDVEKNFKSEVKGPEESCSSTTSESDPLDSIIGPLPPLPEPKVKLRGRGALTATSTSAIDNHFKTGYDPANDTRPDPDLEADDWDQALEALRDRQKWQRQGAERLRAAGFSDEQVLKWTSGKQGLEDVEKGEEDVKWRRKGEGREWDRGKMVTDDGVKTGPEWGRLKEN